MQNKDYADLAHTANKEGKILVKEDNTYVIKEKEVSFETQKKQKLEAVKSCYSEYIKNNTADYNGMSFSIHEEAQQNLTSTVLMAKTFGTDITYFERNGTSHTFSLEEFLPISAIIAETIQNAKSKLYTLEASINNATNKDELDTITCTF